MFQKRVVVFLLGVFFLFFITMSAVHAEATCFQFTGTNKTACTAAFNSSCDWTNRSINSLCVDSAGCCKAKDCWSMSVSDCSSSTAVGCVLKNQSGVAWCEKVQCYNGEKTNQSYCETKLNQTYGLRCSWTNNSGQEYCVPGNWQMESSCSSRHNDSFGCLSISTCQWNATTSGSSVGLCLNRDLVSTVGGATSKNPTCAIFGKQGDCLNITGCSWNTALQKCGGLDFGVPCANISSSSFCGSIPVLSTCCAWGNNGCNITTSNSCWQNMQPKPTGSAFCEDYNSFKNETLCGNLQGTPWYMPCKWNNLTRECHFNGADSFGGGLDKINTKTNCEAASGKWRSQSFNEGGATKKDEWCEYNFFSSTGNCDSTCWACENQKNGSKWGNLSAAIDACGSSTLGYCNFTAIPTAKNGFGFCNPKTEFKLGGSCSSSCNDCNAMNTPELSCNASVAGCRWTADAVNASYGTCQSKSFHSCSDDCFQCSDSLSCGSFGKGGSGNCIWDTNINICKPSGFSGEICFDGIDNDNNFLTDCKDPSCAYDTFCGGGIIDNKNCVLYATNATCTSANCIWLRSKFEIAKSSTLGHCGFPGEQCGENKVNITCSANTDCVWKNAFQTYCEFNQTVTQTCLITISSNVTANRITCNALASCGWVNTTSPAGFGSESGYCGPNIAANCTTSLTATNKTGCESSGCAWINESFSTTGGHCAAKCFGYDAGACAGNSQCQLNTGYCDALKTSTGCRDLNQANCLKNNLTCGFRPDKNICEDKLASRLFEGSDTRSKPTILGMDAIGEAVSELDIMGFGLKDNFNSISLGMQVVNFENATACYGIGNGKGGVGTGNVSTKYYWYLDSDGNTTDGCPTRDNTSVIGFEFYFTYGSARSNGTIIDTIVARKCTTGNWTPIAIPLSVDRETGCSFVSGPVIAIDKKSLESFSVSTKAIVPGLGLVTRPAIYSKTAIKRIYVATANDSKSELNVSDAASVGFFTPGAMDFGFEDCNAKGQDMDGDGLTAENDPDCTTFFKQGYMTIEAGPQCKDNIDNDGNGLTDCNDNACKYDQFFCGGNLTLDTEDKTAPKVTWLNRDTFADSASVQFDTNEPSNGTLLFYYNDSSCGILNKSIIDFATLQNRAITEKYKQFHSVALDNFSYNPQRLATALTNATAYYFKTQNCDISGNCAVSKCMNFTTKDSTGTCTSCRSTMSFGFTPLGGKSSTDATGNIFAKFKLLNGSEFTFGAGETFSQDRSVAAIGDIDLSNPNSTSAWGVGFINATFKKMSESTGNISGGDLKVNLSGNGQTFTGLSSEKCQALIQELRPERLKLCFPGNQTELWQCSDDLTTCVNKTSNATKINYNLTINQSCWAVPTDWGC